MKAGAQVALGVGIGYLLGRTRKMRWAIGLAVAGATGRLGSSPGQLLQRGAKLIQSSPAIGRLTETVRGELLDAVKSAAVATASHRIDALSERIQERAGVPGRPKAAEGAEEEPKEEEEPSARHEEEETERPEQAPAEETSEEEPSTEQEEEEGEEGEEEEKEEEPSEEEEEERAPERPAARRRRTTAGEGRPRRPAREKATDEEEESARPRRRTTRASTSERAPVRRR